MCHAGLESVEVESVGEKSPSSKESVTKALQKPGDDLPTNRSIIAAIAKGLQDSSHVEDIVTMASAGHANAQHVLLLALCHACSQAAEPGTQLKYHPRNASLASSLQGYCFSAERVTSTRIETSIHAFT